ncbi:DUF5667 domain-containing protein [Methanocella paludicola]|nr:DUF5667 domain-containing protein [Methanocella paludicola]
MMRKITSLTVAFLILAAMAPVSLAQQDDITPYNGWAGADSPFYGLKLFIENIDESLAGNSTMKLEKQMLHAEERLCEAQGMALRNNTRAMEAAINGYSQKLGEINATMNRPDVDEGQYANVGKWLNRHQNQFAYMVNDTTCTPEARNCWNNAFQYSMGFQNGRPFTNDNGNIIFTPPGQAKNGVDSTFVPPGIQNKGTSTPAGNGNQQQGAGQPIEHNYSYDYSYNNSLDYGLNCTGNCTDNNYSNNYNETNLSPGPHQGSNGKK